MEADLRLPLASADDAAFTARDFARLQRVAAHVSSERNRIRALLAKHDTMTRRARAAVAKVRKLCAYRWHAAQDIFINKECCALDHLNVSECQGRSLLSHHLEPTA